MLYVSWHHTVYRAILTACQALYLVLSDTVLLMGPNHSGAIACTSLNSTSILHSDNSFFSHFSAIVFPYVLLQLIALFSSILLPANESTHLEWDWTVTSPLLFNMSLLHPSRRILSFKKYFKWSSFAILFNILKVYFILGIFHVLVVNCLSFLELTRLL